MYFILPKRIKSHLCPYCSTQIFWFGDKTEKGLSCPACQKRLLIIILFIVISSSIPILLSQYVFKKHVRTAVKKAISNTYIRQLFDNRQLILTTFSTGTLALLNNVDILYVKKMFSPEDAGIYSSWALFAKLFLFALGPIITTSYIFFSSNKHLTHHKRTSLILILLLGFAGLLMSFVYQWYGAWIVTRFFGNAFIRVIPYLQLAAYYGSGYMIMIFMTNYFLAKKSLLSLTPALLFPVYLGTLMIYPQSIEDIMQVNIVFTSVVVLILLIGFLKVKLLRKIFQPWFGILFQD